MAQRSLTGTWKAYEGMTPKPFVITSKKYPGAAVTKAIVVERRRSPRKAPPRRHALPGSEMVVTRRAENIESLLPTLKHGECHWKGKGFGRLLVYCSSDKTPVQLSLLRNRPLR